MPFELPELPYAIDALAPLMSEETLSFHHGKHHAAYINNLNRLVEGTEWEDKSLEEIIVGASGGGGAAGGASAPKGLFNNAAQAWNHEFFWNSMSPSGGGSPAAGHLADAVEQSFGSYDAFCEEFTAKAVGLFGSGWVWLAAEQQTAEQVSGQDTKLSILTTSNAEIPIAELKTGGLLLTLDVWEHAYYLDFQNNRPGYVKAWIESLLNWEFASQNFAKKFC